MNKLENTYNQKQNTNEESNESESKDLEKISKPENENLTEDIKFENEKLEYSTQETEKLLSEVGGTEGLKDTIASMDSNKIEEIKEKMASAFKSFENNKSEAVRDLKNSLLIAVVGGLTTFAGVGDAIVRAVPDSVINNAGEIGHYVQLATGGLLAIAGLGIIGLSFKVGLDSAKNTVEALKDKFEINKLKKQEA